MTRDFSQFLPTDRTAPPARGALAALGWQGFFAAQISAEEWHDTPPVRITQVNRSGFLVLGDGIETRLPPDAAATVGDWVLYDAATQRAARVLDRKSLIKRRAPGESHAVQLIAANLDTVFIVTSCNADFNVARLERYIALAFEAEVTPVIVLTKVDLCDAPDSYVAQAAAISDRVEVVLLNAKSDAPRDALAPWCGAGQTVGFLGSSGVGKSTLVNALSGMAKAATQDIREDDAKGRHTTTRRQLHFLESGCAVLDTPGMRELQLTDAASGIDDVFADLQELSTRCKFTDCAHQSEPGCAILKAAEQGLVDLARMERWKKLVAEDHYNSLTPHERRLKDKTFGKLVKSATRKSRR